MEGKEILKHPVILDEEWELHHSRAPPDLACIKGQFLSTELSSEEETETYTTKLFLEECDVYISA